MGALKNFLKGTFVLAVLFITGTLIIQKIEGFNLLNSFYYVFLSVSTVGAPINPATNYGKIITIILVSLGMGAVLYIATLVAKAVIESQTRLILTGLKGGIARMKKEKNHIIVCGYGKLGKYVCESLKEQKKHYLVIEKDSEKVMHLLEKGESIIQGDALEPAILKKANIDQAEALIATLKDDADNIYLIMSASELNPNILLAAKADDESAVKRLHKTGAQIVVMPQVVGGKQLVNAVLQVKKTGELSAISKKEKKRR